MIILNDLSNRNTGNILVLLIVLLMPFTGVRSQLVRERKIISRAAIGSSEILGQEALSSGILYLSPREFSNWEEKFWLYWGSNLKRAYTSPPVWDKDGWVVNYVGHPLQGSFFSIQSGARVPDSGNRLRSMYSTPFSGNVSWRRSMSSHPSTT